MNPAIENQMAEATATMTANGEAQQPEQTSPPVRIDLTWDKELCVRNTPLPPTLIEGYLHRGEVSLLAGASKAGKSWMGLQMAKCIGAGIDFLGCKTTPGISVYINTEIAAPFWEQRSREMNDKLALSTPPQVLHASTRGQHLTTKNVIPLLKDALGRMKLQQVDFIVIDPYYTLAAGFDENAAGEVATAMLGFQKMAEEMNAGVLITHHFTKGNAAGKTMLDRASGSGVFARSVDNFFTLTENANGKMVLEATRRNAASPPPLEVKFDYPIWNAVGEAEAIVPKKRGRDSGYDPELFIKAFPMPFSALTGDMLHERVGATSLSTFFRWKQQAIDDGVIRKNGRNYFLTEESKEKKQQQLAKDEAEFLRVASEGVIPLTACNDPRLDLVQTNLQLKAEADSWTADPDGVLRLKDSNDYSARGFQGEEAGGG